MVTRRSVPAVLLALLALAIAAGGAAAAPDALRAPTPRCATSGLVVWLDTQGDGAAGSVYYRLRFTNLGASACTLNGFPGVSAVDLKGKQLGSAAGRDTTTAVKSIKLAPGARASAVLRIVAAGNFPSATCGQTTAAGLRVYPPNQTAAKVVPFPFRACSKAGPIFLQVRTVTAG